MSIPINDLISSLNIKISKNASLEKYLENAAKILSKDKKFGFIVMTKVISNPLEYNFWVVSDKNYLEKHKLLQSVDLGLNAITLERFKTIIPLKNKLSKQSDSVLITNKEFSDSDSGINYYYILETLDGENYRFLTSFSGENPVLFSPATWFENLNDKKYSPSRRLESYNTILNQEIMTAVQKPYLTIEQLNREEVQKEDSYWKSLRNKIKNQVMNDFASLFEEIFIENKEKTTEKNITKLFLNDNLYKNALNYFTENIELDNISSFVIEKVNPTILKEFQVELTLSYFYDLTSIQKSFRKDVENIYKKEYIAKIHAMSGDKILYVKNKVNDIFSMILDEILEKFINRKSGIYLSIQKKFDILSKTFLI
jgi:hypothetical protein